MVNRRKLGHQRQGNLVFLAANNSDLSLFLGDCLEFRRKGDFDEPHPDCDGPSSSPSNRREKCTPKVFSALKTQAPQQATKEVWCIPKSLLSREEQGNKKLYTKKLPRCLSGPLRRVLVYRFWPPIKPSISNVNLRLAGVIYWQTPPSWRAIGPFAPEIPKRSLGRPVGMPWTNIYTRWKRGSFHKWGGGGALKNGTMDSNMFSMNCKGFRDFKSKLKGEEKKRSLQEHPFGRPFPRATPSPLLWRVLPFPE